MVTAWDFRTVLELLYIHFLYIKDMNKFSIPAS